MQSRALAAGLAAFAALAVAACSSSDSAGPTGGITCSPSDPVCAPAGLSAGFNGAAGTPTIAPSNSSTSASVSASAFSVTGTTSATGNGNWLLVVGNEQRATGVLAVSAGVFAGEIPLFCGAQQIIYTFTNGSGRSYWLVNVTLTGCTTAAMRVQLTWDTGPSSDIDLHLLRPGGSMTTSNDCYYGNCQGVALEWGAAGAPGNPILDVDDTEGWGPENIIITSGLEAGEYRIVIHNYDGSAATTATVKLYFNDVEQRRWTSVTLDPGVRDYWEVAKVNALTGTITNVGTYSTTPPVVAPFQPVAPARAK